MKQIRLSYSFIVVNDPKQIPWFAVRDHQVITYWSIEEIKFDLRTIFNEAQTFASQNFSYLVNWKLIFS